jgi:hypothetical protein
MAEFAPEQECWFRVEVYGMGRDVRWIHGSCNANQAE